MRRQAGHGAVFALAVAAAGVGIVVAVALSFRPAETRWSQQVTLDATVGLATATATNTPVPPTATNTPVGPTPTPTNTPVGPTPTPTNTPPPSLTSLKLSCGTTPSSTCTPQDSTPPSQNQLTAGTANGSVVLNSSGNVDNTIAWWKSVPTVTVTSRTGWTVTLDVIARQGTVDVEIFIWRTAGVCGNPPAGTDVNYIAGGTIQNVNAVGVRTSPALTAGTNTSPVPAGGYICLRLRHATGASVTLATTGASVITGPFTTP